MRNFCIIAHIDHGKSTLADRFLELTGTVDKRVMKNQYLDQMDLERERGITIKLAPVRMVYRRASKDSEASEAVILNLIDTPGHVDFAYEVSRSLAAVDGAILLVDASQGIQAQTLANYELARSLGLSIVPAVNKIDLPAAQPDVVARELAELMGCEASEVLHVSGKTGIGALELLEAVVRRIPPPRGADDKPLRALIFDSVFDSYRGVVAYVRVVDGHVRAGSALAFLGTHAKSECLEVGVFTPKLTKTNELRAGEIGYIVTGLKSIQGARVGDTITELRIENSECTISALPGYHEVTPMVFAGIYPKQTNDSGKLRDALEKLKLNDASLSLEPERSSVFGFGFRAGFLGLLHLDIVRERLRREYTVDVIVAMPSVAYHAKLPDGRTTTVKSAFDLPDPSLRVDIEEPVLSVGIIAPAQYMGSVMQVAQRHRAIYQTTEHAGATAILRYEIPLAAMLTDFYDELKSVSQGYASYSYALLGYRPCKVSRLDILIAEEAVEELASIVYTDEAQARGRTLVEKLKETLPRQMFEMKIQSAIGGNILASERLPAMRKDVLKGMSGGDYSRKRKLLEQQKKGKKKMKEFGRVSIPPEAYMALLKR